MCSNEAGAMPAGMWFSEVVAVADSGCRIPTVTLLHFGLWRQAQLCSPSFCPSPLEGWLPADHVHHLKGPWHPQKNFCCQYSPPAGTWRQAHTYTCTAPLSSLSALLGECWRLLFAVRGSKEVLQKSFIILASFAPTTVHFDLYWSTHMTEELLYLGLQQL